DDLERQTLPRTGVHPMSEVVPPAVATDPQIRGEVAMHDTGNVGDTRKGGWFVRITIAVIVVLWLIPPLGVLITSFRPESAVDATGWWTVFAHPFDTAQWT